MSKHRSIVLTDRQADFLDIESKRLGISVADVVRRFLDRIIEDRNLDQALDARRAGRSK